MKLQIKRELVEIFKGKLINMKKKRKLFCEYGPIFYKISLIKETLKKNLKDFNVNIFIKEF